MPPPTIQPAPAWRTQRMTHLAQNFENLTDAELNRYLDEDEKESRERGKEQRKEMAMEWARGELGRRKRRDEDRAIPPRDIIYYFSENSLPVQKKPKQSNEKARSNATDDQPYASVSNPLKRMMSNTTDTLPCASAKRATTSTTDDQPCASTCNTPKRATCNDLPCVPVHNPPEQANKPNARDSLTIPKQTNDHDNPISVPAEEDGTRRVTRSMTARLAKKRVE